MDNYTYLMKSIIVNGFELENQKDIYFYQNNMQILRFRVNLYDGEFNKSNLLKIIDKLNNSEETSFILTSKIGSFARKIEIDSDMMIFTISGPETYFQVVLKCNKVLENLFQEILLEHEREEQRIKDRDDVI